MHNFMSIKIQNKANKQKQNKIGNHSKRVDQRQN